MMLVPCGLKPLSAEKRRKSGIVETAAEVLFGADEKLVTSHQNRIFALSFSVSFGLTTISLKQGPQVLPLPIYSSLFTCGSFSDHVKTKRHEMVKFSYAVSDVTINNW